MERSNAQQDKTVNIPVLLHEERITRGKQPKLSPPWIGPYEVADVDDANITLKFPRNRTIKVHGNGQTLLWLTAGQFMPDCGPALSNAAATGAMAPVMYFYGALRKHT
jgi:hypothetical protein